MTAMSTSLVRDCARVAQLWVGGKKPRRARDARCRWCYPIFVAKWCTVTVTDADGRRHSVDVQATSTFDAAHLYVTEARKERSVGFPKLTLATVFEVAADGKIYRVKGEALQRWIVERRQKWNGPKGYMFTQRPGLV